MPRSIEGVFVELKYLGRDIASCLEPIGTKTGIFEDLDAMVNAIVAMLKPDDQILAMSNGGFGGVHGKILAKLAQREMGRSDPQ